MCLVNIIVIKWHLQTKLYFIPIENPYGMYLVNIIVIKLKWHLQTKLYFIPIENPYEIICFTI